MISQIRLFIFVQIYICTETLNPVNDHGDISVYYNGIQERNINSTEIRKFATNTGEEINVLATDKVYAEEDESIRNSNNNVTDKGILKELEKQNGESFLSMISKAINYFIENKILQVSTILDVNDRAPDNVYKVERGNKYDYKYITDQLIKSKRHIPLDQMNDNDTIIEMINEDETTDDTSAIAKIVESVEGMISDLKDDSKSNSYNKTFSVYDIDDESNNKTTKVTIVKETTRIDIEQEKDSSEYNEDREVVTSNIVVYADEEGNEISTTESIIIENRIEVKEETQCSDDYYYRYFWCLYAYLYGVKGYNKYCWCLY